MYIGKTARHYVEERIIQHIDDPIGKWAKSNDHYVEFLELPKEEDMNYIESYLIRQYLPPCNTIFASDTRLPPFEIFISEDKWLRLDEYIENKNKNRQEIEDISNKNITNNLSVLAKKFAE